MAARWLGLGPALVLVTLGKDGSAGFGAALRATAASRPVTVVDTVGAGDAFTSAALAHLHRHGALERHGLEALDASELAALLAFANEIAADTCTRAGADPPRGR
jgi:fructokinase